MELWLCDNAEHRDWKTTLGGEVSRVRLEGANRRTSLPTFISEETGEAISGPGLVLIHPDPGLPSLKRCVPTTENSDLRIATISAGSRWGCPQVDTSRIYRIQSPVPDIEPRLALALLRFLENPKLGMSTLDFGLANRAIAALYLIVFGARSENGKSFRKRWARVNRLRREGLLRASWEILTLDGWPPDVPPLDLPTLIDAPEEVTDKQVDAIWARVQADDIPCRVAGEIGWLRHSWLENTVFTLSPEFVTRLYADQNPDESTKRAHASLKQRLEASDGWLESLGRVRTLIVRLEEGFSSTALLAEAPLVGLDRVAREDLAAVLKSHEEPLVSKGELDELTHALDEWRTVYVQLRTAFLVYNVQPDEVEEIVEVLQERGRVVFDILGQFPKGVQLPWPCHGS